MKIPWHGLLTTLVLLVAVMATETRADHIVGLNDLFDGESLIDGSTTYSNFQLISDIGTVSPNFDDIRVEGIGNGLEFFSQNEFFLFPGDESLILQFSYEVNSTDSQFGRGASSFASDVPFILGEGLADLFVDFETIDGEVLASTNAIIDPAFGIEQLFDQQGFGSIENELSVQASLSLFSDDNSLVALRSFQILNSIPEPGTSLLTCLLMGAAAFCRRR